MSIFTMFISPIEIFFMAIKQRTADHWLSTWNEVTNNKLQSIKNCIKLWPSSSQRIRHDEVILTRLRIGHTRVTYSFLMENGNMPYCQDCLVPLSVLHILAECPTYDDERRPFFPNTVNMSTSDRMVSVFIRASYWYVRYRESKGIS